MNATIISAANRLDEIFERAWAKLPEQEKFDALSDTMLYGVSLIEVRDDGSARRIDPSTTLAHLK